MEPISLIDNDFPTIAIAPDNKQRAVYFQILRNKKQNGTNPSNFGLKN